MMNGRPALYSDLDIEDLTSLQGFKLLFSGRKVLDFVLSKLPLEMQEALNHEATNE